MEQFKKLRQFLNEVWSELKKTSWPTRPEIYGTTVVVIVTVFFCAFYLWVVDIFLSKGMSVVFEAFK